MIDISSKLPLLESAHHLAYYFPSSHERESDTISSHILQFKDNQEPFVTKWIDLVISDVDSLPLVDFIVRVLGSDEISASGNTSLDKLGRAMAEATDAKYCPTWVEKTRQTQPLKFMGKAARQNELDGIFTFSIKGEKRGNPRLNKGGKRFKKIMILDDVTTTGSTIKELYRTIYEKYPDCPVHAFVLGKTFDSWTDGKENNNQLLIRFNNAGGERDINYKRNIKKGIYPNGDTYEGDILDDIRTDKGTSISKMTPLDLGKSGKPSAIIPLIEYLKKGTPNERRLAASAIGKLQNDFLMECKKAIPHLINNLELIEQPQGIQYSLKTLYRFNKNQITKTQVEKIKNYYDNESHKYYNDDLFKKILNKFNNAGGGRDINYKRNPLPKVKQTVGRRVIKTSHPNIKKTSTQSPADKPEEDYLKGILILVLLFLIRITCGV